MEQSLGMSDTNGKSMTHTSCPANELGIHSANLSD